MEIKKLLSAISGIIFFLAFFPYIWAIVKTRKLPLNDPKRAAPQKSSWLIWASLDTITMAGMYAKHSLNGQIIGTIFGAWVTVGFALKYGKSGWSKLDKLCLAGAVLGVSIWALFHNPMLAVVAVLVVVFLASIPTFVNAWHNPQSESKLAWTLYFISCIIALFAIPQWTIEDAAQPVTFTMVETTMMYLLYVHGRKRG